MSVYDRCVVDAETRRKAAIVLSNIRKAARDCGPLPALGDLSDQWLAIHTQLAELQHLLAVQLSIFERTP